MDISEYNYITMYFILPNGPFFSQSFFIFLFPLSLPSYFITSNFHSLSITFMLRTSLHIWKFSFLSLEVYIYLFGKTHLTGWRIHFRSHQNHLHSCKFSIMDSSIHFMKVFIVCETYFHFGFLNLQNIFSPFFHLMGVS